MLGSNIPCVLFSHCNGDEVFGALYSFAKGRINQGSLSCSLTRSILKGVFHMKSKGKSALEADGVGVKTRSAGKAKGKG